MGPVFQLTTLNKWDAWILEKYQQSRHSDAERESEEYKASSVEGRCWGHLGEMAVCLWFEALGVWYYHDGTSDERDENGYYTVDFRVWSRNRWIKVEVKTAYADNSRYCMAPDSQWEKLTNRTDIIIAVRKVGESHAEIAGWNGSRDFGEFTLQNKGDPGVPVSFPTRLRLIGEMESPDLFARYVKGRLPKPLKPK